jgi:hypothetical protein
MSDADLACVKMPTPLQRFCGPVGKIDSTATFAGQTLRAVWSKLRQRCLARGPGDKEF